ncbi:Crp/Fnr family transcriptional regulator [Myroides indicus]|uniref:CRP-like cAMP-binding protein n=1 Tax=Myroides indicus TaxID=1323422 RepID=A0A4V3E8H9_9FLAO|nr:Crp/Fnr family transcriptional regulator [Myroides indicus]TDS58225.1 CRP-like cAMP-binding protein [Myroides indicus]
MIKLDLLMQSGAEIRELHKNEIVFSVDHYPTHYYQVLEGKIKMNNYNEDGKEFIQNIFTVGQSFGEPPLFIDEPYPASAVAVTNATVVQLKKNNFYEMLKKYPETSLAVTQSLARRLYYKSVMAPEISSQDPEKRILTLIDYMKEHQSIDLTKDFLVPLTRQQLADLTGLRVETVIRTVKQLEKREQLKIISGKVYR